MTDRDTRMEEGITPASPEMLELAGIARKLTPAQRKMVLTDGKGFVSHHVGKWFCGTITTAQKLHAAGLIQVPDNLAFPTPLGLALRAHLLETSHD